MLHSPFNVTCMLSNILFGFHSAYHPKTKHLRPGLICGNFRNLGGKIPNQVSPNIQTWSGVRHSIARANGSCNLSLTTH